MGASIIIAVCYICRVVAVSLSGHTSVIVAKFLALYKLNKLSKKTQCQKYIQITIFNVHLHSIPFYL